MGLIIGVGGNAGGSGSSSKQYNFSEFATKADYEEAKSTLVTPNVSLVAGGVEYAPRNIPWGAYLHSDGTVDNIAAPDVIGICVIPSSHYGKARFMSVVRMSASSDQGTTEDEAIVFWNEDDGFTTPYTNKKAGMDLIAGKMYSHIVENWAALPTDRIHGGYEDEGIVEGLTIPATWDQSAIYWYNDGDEENRYVPSPFLADGSLNPDYRLWMPNCLADIDGKKNTDLYLAKSESNHPAALACRNFNPGFGEWYLPAVGELAYLVPRWGAITDKLTELAAAGCRVAQLGVDAYFWSSSASSPNGSWLVDLDGGRVDNSRRLNRYDVLAFSAL